jgi:hypothetical protein
MEVDGEQKSVQRACARVLPPLLLLPAWIGGEREKGWLANGEQKRGSQVRASRRRKEIRTSKVGTVLGYVCRKNWRIELLLYCMMLRTVYVGG